MSSEGEFESRYAAVLDDTLRNALSEARRLYENMVEELQEEMCSVKTENEALRSKYDRLKKQRRSDTASQCDILHLPDCIEVSPEQQERSLGLVPEEQDLLQRPSEDASDDWEDTREGQSALKSMNAHKTRSVDGQRRSLRNKLSQDLKSSKQTPSMSHTGFKPVSCTVCGKGFHNNSALNIHTRVHTGEKPFTCTVCGKGCYQMCDLKKHMRTHTGQRPFTCTICGKSFHQNGHLEMHNKIHIGKKPFTCAVCHKSFIQNASLNRHMFVHSGQKPFSCTACGKRFNQSCHLQQHIRTHTGEKPFSCTVCSKRFSTNIQRKRHMRSHTEDENLEKHMTLSHIGQEPCINLYLETYDHSYAMLPL